MIKKLLLIGTLMIAILFESTAVCGAADAKDKKQYPEVSQSAVKIDTTVLDKTLDTQKNSRKPRRKRKRLLPRKNYRKK
ncbi:ErfK/YbiS/YcfS/YnhG family protein [Ruminiclostridium papyrosolvens DSM 2782]|uniref:ErfK/YbiS/YcfS/YnhG family protein n=1 Tax=Ruminiclostridium papyrosolvens DSM 2782 TaxID=588581 RepID=F1TCB9_9FIRM|nr:hypothetical protein [Ruminiclostridium papyrosolvens]EGD48034.1 ErfK/YbiS/YcfS/YnhG family protein [Ruminiclostridium papyrosolvens DSM 2782]